MAYRDGREVMAAKITLTDAQRELLGREIKQAFDLADDHLDFVPEDSFSIEVLPSGATVEISMVKRVTEAEARAMVERIWAGGV